MPISRRGRTWLAAVFLLLPSLVLTVLLHTLAVDDAFITYRYAANLAAGLGFVYNPGQSVLSTTAPLYGLLLSLPACLGWQLPLASNVLYGLSIGAGAVAIYLFGRNHRQPVTGWLAGLVYSLMPLLWLALGMETALWLAFVLAALACDAYQRPGWAGLCLGLAVVTRYDAALAAVILFGARLASGSPPFLANGPGRRAGRGAFSSLSHADVWFTPADNAHCQTHAK